MDTAAQRLVNATGLERRMLPGGGCSRRGMDATIDHNTATAAAAAAAAADNIFTRYAPWAADSMFVGYPRLEAGITGGAISHSTDGEGPRVSASNSSHSPTSACAIHSACARRSSPLISVLLASVAAADRRCVDVAVDEASAQSILEDHLLRVWNDEVPCGGGGGHETVDGRDGKVRGRRDAKDRRRWSQIDEDFDDSSEEMKMKSVIVPSLETSSCNRSRDRPSRVKSADSTTSTSSTCQRAARQAVQCGRTSSSPVDSSSCSGDVVQSTTWKRYRSQDSDQLLVFNRAGSGDATWRTGTITGPANLELTLSHSASRDPGFRDDVIAWSSQSASATDDEAGFTTVVGYYFCDEPIPYRTTLTGRRPTLGQFKQLLTKKGHWRYFFKKASDEFDSGVVHEEVTDDSQSLPLYDGKIVGKVERYQ